MKINKVCIAFIMAVVWFVPSELWGQFYQWQDENGQWHFSDSPHKFPNKKKQFAESPGFFNQPQTEEQVFGQEPSMDRGESHQVKIFLTQLGFSPVVMKVAATSNNSTGLSDLKPSGIFKEPRYEGAKQKYGFIELGTGDNNIFNFAFDSLNEDHPKLYFDKNQNGDLTDDGGPFTNQGSGIFATVLDFPFNQIVDQIASDDPFYIWFYTNNSLWKKEKVTFYNRTQLKGEVTLDGVSYLAYIADYRINDADFTNDGISIDIDGNGKIDRKSEFFKPGEIAEISGKKYQFIIDW